MKTIEQRDIVATDKAVLVDGEPVFFATPTDFQEWFDYGFKIKTLEVNLEGDTYSEEAHWQFMTPPFRKTRVSLRKVQWPDEEP